MGKVLIINKVYKITKGAFIGFTGKLVAYDALKDEATLKVDKDSIISVVSENLEMVPNIARDTALGEN